MTHHIGVIQFPGSNCERETKLALQRAQLTPVDIFWFDKTEKLMTCDGFVIVGGFSYEDRCRSGVIASLDPMIQALTKEVKKGKPVLGICNGAQILVESGLVPGCVNAQGDLQTVMALTHNRRIKNGEVIGTGYYNNWCKIQSEDTPVLHIPFAHAEGRFLLSDALYQLLQRKLVACWYYVNENPNGSYKSLAAVGNFSGNVLAMMPHPERTPNGDFVFQHMRDFFKKNKSFIWKTQPAPPTKTHIQKIDLSHYTQHYFVKLGITDNEALSAQLVLQQRNITVRVSKYHFWGLQINRDELPKIENSFELWNPQKEDVSITLPSQVNAHYLMVSEDHDILAAEKKAHLQQQCNITTLKKLSHGIVWALTGEKIEVEKALQTHLFANPISQQQQWVTREDLCLA